MTDYLDPRFPRDVVSVLNESSTTPTQPQKSYKNVHKHKYVNIRRQSNLVIVGKLEQFGVRNEMRTVCATVPR